MIIVLPVGRGEDPQVSTTVANAILRPASCQRFIFCQIGFQSVLITAILVKNDQSASLVDPGSSSILLKINQLTLAPPIIDYFIDCYIFIHIR